MVVIKDILNTYGLKTNGKKAELIQRLIENVSQEEIIQKFSNRKYMRTAIGQEELDNEEYVRFIHGRNIEDLDIWSLNRLVYSGPKMPYRDKIWRYLNERCVKHATEGNYGLYRNCKYSMACLVMNEGKNKVAIATLAEVLFYDLADTFYTDIKEPLPSVIIGDIAYCKEELEYSDEDFKSALVELTKGLSVPKQKYSTTQCIDKIVEEVKVYIANNPSHFGEDE